MGITRHCFTDYCDCCGRLNEIACKAREHSLAIVGIHGWESLLPLSFNLHVRESVALKVAKENVSECFVMCQSRVGVNSGQTNLDIMT